MQIDTENFDPDIHLDHRSLNQTVIRGEVLVSLAAEVISTGFNGK